jgi:hypothetical protein
MGLSSEQWFISIIGPATQSLSDAGPGDDVRASMAIESDRSWQTGLAAIWKKGLAGIWEIGLAGTGGIWLAGTWGPGQTDRSANVLDK